MWKSLLLTRMVVGGESVPGGEVCRQRERGLGLVDITGIVLFRRLVSLLFSDAVPLVNLCLEV